MLRRPARVALFPYTTLFRSEPGGELRSGRAWSTMKVPVIVASITAGRADWDAIEAAITRSDNDAARRRSEEHTSELQSQSNLVCRLLREKNNFSMLMSACVR